MAAKLMIARLLFDREGAALLQVSRAPNPSEMSRHILRAHSMTSHSLFENLMQPICCCWRRQQSSSSGTRTIRAGCSPTLHSVSCATYLAAQSIGSGAHSASLVSRCASDGVLAAQRIVLLHTCRTFAASHDIAHVECRTSIG